MNTGCMDLCKLQSSLNICPGVGLMDHMVILILAFWGTVILFSIVVVRRLWCSVLAWAERTAWRPLCCGPSNGHDMFRSGTSRSTLMCSEHLPSNLSLPGAQGVSPLEPRPPTRPANTPDHTAPWQASGSWLPTSFHPAALDSMHSGDVLPATWAYGSALAWAAHYPLHCPVVWPCPAQSESEPWRGKGSLGSLPLPWAPYSLLELL